MGDKGRRRAVKERKNQASKSFSRVKASICWQLKALFYLLSLQSPVILETRILVFNVDNDTHVIHTCI